MTRIYLVTYNLQLGIGSQIIKLTFLFNVLYILIKYNIVLILNNLKCENGQIVKY